VSSGHAFSNWPSVIDDFRAKTTHSIEATEQSSLNGASIFDPPLKNISSLAAS